MIKVQAINEETNNLMNFFISQNISNLDEFKDCLNYIRYGYHRNWRQVKHTPILDEVVIGLPRTELKYITVQNESDEIYIIVFDKSINHDYMYLAVSHMGEEYLRKLSAGFTDGLSCYGRSETLNLDSNPDDFKLIT